MTDEQRDDRTIPGWWHRWYTLRFGRHYGTYRPGSYLLPCDDVGIGNPYTIFELPLTPPLQVECDRLDIMHKFFLVARQFLDSTFGGLYTHRLPDRPKILDLGCGTGIWAIDTAELVNISVTC
jgi:SAM-dependent methyltransferase